MFPSFRRIGEKRDKAKQTNQPTKTSKKKKRNNSSEDKKKRIK